MTKDGTSETKGRGQNEHVKVKNGDEKTEGVRWELHDNAVVSRWDEEGVMQATNRQSAIPQRTHLDQKA